MQFEDDETFRVQGTDEEHSYDGKTVQTNVGVGGYTMLVERSVLRQNAERCDTVLYNPTLCRTAQKNTA